ncbi:MAG: superoxide dismutase [Chitinophagaceae bacterium]
MQKNARRNFLKQTSKAAAIVALNQLIPLQKIFAQPNTIKFTQQPLPFAVDAITNFVDATTMQIHYSKHAAAYCKNLNEAYAQELGLKNRSLEKILDKISKYSIKMRNNGGGHFNHEFFWQCIKPSTTKAPQQKTLALIMDSFGSVENFKQQFSDAAKQRFGSGWAWLVLNKKGKLIVGNTPNQDNPLMNVSTLRGKPVLALDVWEHAYYLKYQNKRADYITNFWQQVNWDFVEQQLI